MRCLVLLFALAIAACGVPQSEFKNTDITGADFGRTLALTDHNSTPRALDEFKGKVVAVFFGFTQCPDACPTTLATLKAVKDRLGADGDKLQVLFVTVDPERDTAPLLSGYVTTFDSSFLGLSGDAAATSRVAKEFKVFYQKVPGKTPETYSVDHTATTYLYDPRGRLRLFVRYGEGVEPIVSDVQRLLAGK